MIFLRRHVKEQLVKYFAMIAFLSTLFHDLDYAEENIILDSPYKNL